MSVGTMERRDRAQPCAWCGRQASLRFRWVAPPGQEHPWRPICDGCLGGLETVASTVHRWETAPL